MEAILAGVSLFLPVLRSIVSNKNAFFTKRTPDSPPLSRNEIPVNQRPESHFRYLTQSMYTQLYELMYKGTKPKCTPQPQFPRP